MKKFISVLLVLVMTAALLGGCSSKKAGNSSSDEVTKAAAKVTQAVADNAGGSAKGKTVGITMPSVGNDFMLALSKAMKGALEKQGLRYRLTLLRIM